MDSFENKDYEVLFKIRDERFLLSELNDNFFSLEIFEFTSLDLELIKECKVIPLMKVNIVESIDLKIFENILNIKSLHIVGYLDLNVSISNFYFSVNSLSLINLNIIFRESITNFHSLEHIKFAGCSIKNLKFLSSNLIELYFLELENIISFEKLWDELLRFKFVHHISLRNNHIKEIPVEFLIKFDFDFVYFGSFLTENFYESFYKILDIGDNPLVDSINEISIFTSMEGYEFDNFIFSNKLGQIQIKEAKMIFLGEPRAGKTTLQKYLMGQNINPKEPSTPDIQISTWHPFELENTDNKDIKINLWDFGGQEIQYSLHKFFMTEDTLYIIVLDSTKDQSPLNYLEFLENYAPGAPFIVINNYADVPTSHTLKLDENYLYENYNGENGKPIVKGVFSRVSVLKASENDPSWRKIMNVVEGKIKDEILKLPNLNKPFPKEYQDIKEAVERIYQEPGRHYLTMSLYREICRDLNITDTEERRIAILKYLNQLGTLRYFGDTDFSDKHILNPKWLIEGAYALLINNITGENNGVLTKKQAYEILKKSSQFRFYEEECEYIFKIMNSFGMLHFNQNEGRIYIPLRFSSKQPISLVDFYIDSRKIFFDFESDIPNDVIATLIVRHFSEINNKLFWMKGAVFQDYDVKILVKAEDRQIQFYLKGDYPQIYFERLRNTLKKILGTLPGLGNSESIEFEYSGKKIIAAYENLVLTLKEKLPFYFDYSQKVKVKTEDIPRILGAYYSEKEITSGITVHGNYFHVERLYQTNNTFLNQIEQLNEVSKDESLKKELESLRAELIQLSSLKDKEEKTGFGKRVLKRIKKLSETATEEVVKEGVKQIFPKALEFFSKIENVNYDDIASIFN